MSIAQLAKLRGLPESGLHAACVSDGFLQLGIERKKHAWFIRDEKGSSARRIDGKSWPARDGQSSKAIDLPGTSGIRVVGWPVGIVHASRYRDIGVFEGGPDALAAVCARELLGNGFGVVCLFGAALTIHESALRHFEGKRVRFFPHNDSAGRSFAERNAELVSKVAEVVTVADLKGLMTVNGTECSDLCDAVAFLKPWVLSNEIAEQFDFNKCTGRIHRFQPLDLFAATAGSNVTEDTEKTEGGQRMNEEGREREKRRGEEMQRLLQVARDLASTARGQSHSKMHTLARHIRGVESEAENIDSELRIAAFNAWYSASISCLNREKSRSEYLADFLGKLRRVRVPIGKGGRTLSDAIEAARRRPLPQFPSEIEVPESWRVLASVCRELQRAAGGAPFFIGTRDAMRIIGAKYPMDGLRALDALEALGVIACSQRGDARPGGKATRYRYLLSP